MPKILTKKDDLLKKDGDKKIKNTPPGDIKKKTKEPEESNVLKGSSRYIYAVGRRKESVAQIRLFTKGKGKIVVNDQNYQKYFPYFEFQQIVTAPLKQVGQDDKIDIIIKVRGGGKRGQAESVRHGIARALIELNENFRKSLRRIGYLTRDSRTKERKKPGLKRARRAPQWKKR